MFKNLSAKYYKENKERLQKKARERYQNLSKEEKKIDNMVANGTKFSQKMKRVNWMSKEKILQNEKKHFIIMIRKYFNLENLLLDKEKY